MPARDHIEVRLILDSTARTHGIRYWHAVPRIGDQIKVRNIDGRDQHLRIRDVIWGDSSDHCVVALMLDDTETE